MYKNFTATYNLVNFDAIRQPARSYIIRELLSSFFATLIYGIG